MRGALLLALLGAPACAGSADTPEPLMIFAAASTQQALELLLASFRRQSGPAVTSYAASSTLARQLDAGAPADLYISANPHWMDTLEARDRLEPGTRRELLRNQLELVTAGAPTDAPPPELGPDFDLSALPEGCVALGDPAHVPAGIYAEAALRALGWWDALADRVVPMVDVRAAAAAVARGECAIGVVYSTDLRGDPGLRSLGRFPERTHPPITYPAALLRDPAPGAAALLDFLQSDAGDRAFLAAGFLLPEDRK